MKKNNSGQAVSPQDAEQDNEGDVEKRQDDNDDEREENNDGEENKDESADNAEDDKDKEDGGAIAVSDVFLNMKLDGQHGKPSRNE